MIKQNGCKCSNAPHPVCAPANVQTTGDNRIMHEPEDQDELMIQCESPVLADDLMTYIQFMEEGWELEGDHEGLDTEHDEGNIFEMPTFLYQRSFSPMGTIGLQLAKAFSLTSITIELD